jgi:hypothetical protein
MTVEGEIVRGTTMGGKPYMKLHVYAIPANTDMPRSLGSQATDQKIKEFAMQPAAISWFQWQPTAEAIDALPPTLRSEIMNKINSASPADKASIQQALINTVERYHAEGKAIDASRPMSRAYRNFYANNRMYEDEDNAFEQRFQNAMWNAANNPCEALLNSNKPSPKI